MPSCYEHQLAPARYALAGLGVNVHSSVLTGYSFPHPIVDAATRHLSYENACFVVVARDVLSQSDLPDHLPLRGATGGAASASIWEACGASAIGAPGGCYPAGPEVFDLHWDRRPRQRLRAAGEESPSEPADE